MFVKKGIYGYIKSAKIRVALITFGMFAISLALFLTGLISTGTKKNLLTVVAVLGCLPACKSAVNMIMFLKARSCPADVYEKIHAKESGINCLYELQITSYEHTFQIDSLVIAGKNICGYTSDPKCKCDLAEKHIQNMLQQNGKNDYTVKIFRELAKYTNRMEQLQNITSSDTTASDTTDSNATDTEAEIISLMKAISL